MRQRTSFKCRQTSGRKNSIKSVDLIQNHGNGGLIAAFIVLSDVLALGLVATFMIPFVAAASNLVADKPLNVPAQNCLFSSGTSMMDILSLLLS